MRRRGAFLQLYYHLVWSTKHRLPFISPEVEIVVLETIHGKCEELGVNLLAANTTEDHIHVLAEVPPTLRLSDVIRHLKGATSYRVNVKRDPAYELHWQDGYGALTVRASEVESIRKYVERQ